MHHAHAHTTSLFLYIVGTLYSYDVFYTLLSLHPHTNLSTVLHFSHKYNFVFLLAVLFMGTKKFEKNTGWVYQDHTHTRLDLKGAPGISYTHKEM